MEETQLKTTAHLICPQCGGTNITLQMFQEDAGTTTVSKTKSKLKQKRHGVIWWIFIGWWWWIIDLVLWICLFPIKLVLSLTKKKKYKGKSTTVSQSINQVKYKTICLCNDCGNSWIKNELASNNADGIKRDIKKMKKAVK